MPSDDAVAELAAHLLEEGIACGCGEPATGWTGEQRLGRRSSDDRWIRARLTCRPSCTSDGSTVVRLVDGSAEVSRG